jgi:succinate-semialdehyde dehydrogenase/glutarate-semialdehyde dehydrogenase
LISGRRSTALVSDERIKGVSLTVVKWFSMAEAAGKYLKSVLELVVVMPL